MITRTNEDKMLVKHISCDCKWKFNSLTCNSNQKWNNDECKCECKKFRASKKDYSWNPSISNCEYRRYLKSIADTPVIVCNEITYATDSVSTNVTSFISTNVRSTTEKNSDNKKERYQMNCSILYTVLLVIMLPFVIAIICHHYTKHRSELKKNCRANNTKMENNEF